MKSFATIQSELLPFEPYVQPKAVANTIPHIALIESHIDTKLNATENYPLLVQCSLSEDDYATMYANDRFLSTLFQKGYSLICINLKTLVYIMRNYESLTVIRFFPLALED